MAAVRYRLSFPANGFGSRGRTTQRKLGAVAAAHRAPQPKQHLKYQQAALESIANHQLEPVQAPVSPSEAELATLGLYRSGAECVGGAPGPKHL